MQTLLLKNITWLGTGPEVQLSTDGDGERDSTSGGLYIQGTTWDNMGHNMDTNR